MNGNNLKVFITLIIKIVFRDDNESRFLSSLQNLESNPFFEAKPRSKLESENQKMGLGMKLGLKNGNKTQKIRIHESGSDLEFTDISNCVN